MENTQQAQSPTFTIKLWPPSSTTRQMLVTKMTHSLSSDNIFSRKYGLLSKQDANEHAKRIEDVCFAAASKHFNAQPDADGSRAVQLYAQETSKMMMEVLKIGPRTKQDGDIVVITQEAVLDISGGRRAFIEEDEAKQLLAPLGAPGNSYTRICLSNRSFSINAALAVSSILGSVKDQLTQVDLSDIVAGRPEEEALQVMRIFSSSLEGSNLKCLNLSNNALGEKGVRAFAALLNQKNLEELYLMNDGISEEAARALCELIPSTDKLRILHFHNNMTGDEGAVAIAQVLKHSPLLEDFRCSSTRVGSEGGIALADALASCPHLKKIDLTDNIFGVDAGIELSKTLEKLTGLTAVLLSYLNLEDEGTIAIANALKVSAPSLQGLELAGNDVTPKGASTLAECIAVKRLLKKLVLSENELKDQGALIIGKALEGHMNLTELDMSNNMITRAGARCLAQAISNIPGFKLLNINGNAISDEGIDDVKEILKTGKNSVDVLGPLDENDVEGELEDEDEEVDAEGKEDAVDGEEGELELKLQHLNVEKD